MKTDTAAIHDLIGRLEEEAGGMESPAKELNELGDPRHLQAFHFLENAVSKIKRLVDPDVSFTVLCDQPSSNRNKCISRLLVHQDRQTIGELNFCNGILQVFAKRDVWKRWCGSNRRMVVNFGAYHGDLDRDVLTTKYLLTDKNWNMV